MSSDPKVLSHNAIRRAVGLVGFFTPVGLFLYGLGGQMQSSISHFYYTEAGDFFVGALCAIAIFLITYRGYPEEFPSKEWFFGDRFASILAAIGAIGVAVFPTTIVPGFSQCESAGSIAACKAPDASPILGPPEGRSPATIELDLVTGIPGPQFTLHAISTAVFLGALIYFCWVLFPRGPRDDEARVGELWLYRICGAVMIVCAALFAATTFTEFDLGTYSVFVYETLAIWAFSIAWLVNGEVLAQLKWKGFLQPRKYPDKK